MPEIRVDPLSGLRSIVGDGSWTPRSPAASPLPDGVVALAPDAPGPEPEANRDLFWAGPALGAYERIPHGSGEVRSVGELSAQALREAMEHWRERMLAHGDAALVHVAVEDGRGAASTCAELFALDFVPAAVARERERFGAYATRTMGGNLLADLVQEEVRRRERVVAIDDESVLMSAFAARAPYQLLIAPRSPRARFEDAGPIAAAMLADALRRLAGRFGAPPPVHIWVRTAPRGTDQFCWRIELVPALGTLDALSAGTGVHINPVAPERAATELREI